MSKRFYITVVFIYLLSYVKAQENWQLFTSANSGIATDYITEVKADNYGNIWTAGRLYLSKYDGNSWASWHLDTLVDGFPYIHDIDFDLANNVWLASDAGVIRFNGYNSWTVYNASNSGITFDLIQSIEVCSDNTIWCGDINSEHVAKLIGSTWTTFAIPGASSGSGDAVYSIDSYQDQVWFSWGVDLFKYDNTGWSKFNMVNSPLDYGFIGDVHVDSTGTVWTTQTRDPYTLASGKLMGYDGAHWVTFDSIECPTLATGLYTFIPDSGAIWLGSPEDGLYHFDGVSYQNFNKTNSVLPSNRILDIDIDKNRNILIGTDSGLVIYNENGIKIGHTQTTNPGEVFELNIYPNPSSDMVSFTWDNSFFYPTINLYSMRGQLVYSQQYQQPPAILNTSLFANGVYDVSFRSGKNIVNKKLVIQHD